MSWPIELPFIWTIGVNESPDPLWNPQDPISWSIELQFIWAIGVNERPMLDPIWNPQDPMSWPLNQQWHQVHQYEITRQG